LARVFACDDGVDNDGDGLVDFPEDPGCANATADRENPQCNDGVDNDGDGKIDFDGGASLDLDHDGHIDARFNPATPAVGAPDPQCTIASRNKEAAGGCGLGAELVFLLPLLARWRLVRHVSG